MSVVNTIFGSLVCERKRLCLYLAVTIVCFILCSLTTALCCSHVRLFRDYCDRVYARFAIVARGVLSSRHLWFAIFIRNLRVLILDLIPFVGVFFYAASIASTSLVLGFVVSEEGVNPLIRVLISPHTYIEFASYVLAVAASLRFFRWWKEGKRYTYFVYVAISVVLLAVSAFIESLEITSFRP